MMDHWRYYLFGRLLELAGRKPQAIAAEIAAAYAMALGAGGRGAGPRETR